MSSRKRTTMAALEPNAKEERDIDPSAKEPRHFNANGEMNNYAQQFAGDKKRNDLKNKPVSRGTSDSDYVMKDLDTKERVSAPYLVDFGYVRRSQTYHSNDASSGDALKPSRSYPDGLFSHNRFSYVQKPKSADVEMLDSDYVVPDFP